MKSSRGLVLVVGLVLAWTPAWADEAAALREARVRFEAGSRHYKIGEFREALSQFKAAFLSKPFPAFLYNIAQCHRQLGEWDKAARQYRIFLKEMPDAPNRDEAARNLADMERNLQGTTSTLASPPPAAPATPATPATVEPVPVAPSVKPAAVKAAPAVTPAPVKPAPVVIAAPTVVGKRKQGKWWIGVVAAGAVAVGGGVTLGVAVGVPGQDAALHPGSAGSVDVRWQ